MASCSVITCTSVKIKYHKTLYETFSSREKSIFWNFEATVLPLLNCYCSSKMEEEHRAILKRHRIAITKDLEVNKVLNRLTVLGDDDRDEIKAGRTRVNQACALLDMLPRKGSNAFKDFVSALFEITGQEHLAKLLAKESGMEISSFSKGEIISSSNLVPVFKRDYFLAKIKRSPRLM